jgi:hypothetical protein
VKGAGVAEYLAPGAVHIGSVLDLAGRLEPASVQTIVTSPPYWGLRSYLPTDHQDKAHELGGEATPGEYVANLVAVFAALRSALKDDGTIWVNLGDCYNAYNGNRGTASQFAGKRHLMEPTYPSGHGLMAKGYPPKCLMGMPWRVAFALIDDGWTLRSDVIWSKPNPMPESVQGTRAFRHRVPAEGQDDPTVLIDCPGCPKCSRHGGYIISIAGGRPTRAHEYLFLLSKSPRYFYDADAIKEAYADGTSERIGQPSLDAQQGGYKTEAYQQDHPGKKARDRRPADILRAMRDNGQPGRNKRDVWTVTPAQFPGAHFATFAPDLIRPCILAGTSERGE